MGKYDTMLRSTRYLDHDDAPMGPMQALADSCTSTVRSIGIRPRGLAVDDTRMVPCPPSSAVKASGLATTVGRRPRRVPPTGTAGGDSESDLAWTSGVRSKTGR